LKSFAKAYFKRTTQQREIVDFIKEASQVF